MNSTTLTAIIHAVVGLAIIGALAALAAVGTITGGQALEGMGVIAGILLGAGAVALGATTTTTDTDPPA